MKSVVIIIFSIFLLACSATTEKQEEEENSALKVDVEHKEASVLDEMILVEEQVEELTYYQKVRENHYKRDVLPQGIVLQNTEEVYDKDILNFERILKIAPNWFLCKFVKWEGEIENYFYFTFDYNGNQLDAKLVNTIAIDLDGEIVFTSDSTFQVNTVMKEMVLKEDDIIEVGESKKDTIYYTLTNKGKIIKYQ